MPTWRLPQRACYNLQVPAVHLPIAAGVPPASAQTLSLASNQSRVKLVSNNQGHLDASHLVRAAPWVLLTHPNTPPTVGGVPLTSAPEPVLTAADSEDQAKYSRFNIKYYRSVFDVDTSVRVWH